MHYQLETPVHPSLRVAHVQSLFDLPVQARRSVAWQLNLPLTERAWSIGLILGPSGSGKSMVARQLFPPGTEHCWLDPVSAWPEQQAVVDGFPVEMSLPQIVHWLGAVGLNTPPAWIRPYATLSTGQRFRVDLARLLAMVERMQPVPIAVVDEFTSVLDRTLAQVASAAIARAVRQRGLRLVAVTGHADVLDWLQPDWVFVPERARLPRVAGLEPAFAWRCLRPRPSIDLHIVRCAASAWGLFAPHHYLSHAVHPKAVCFMACRGQEPVGFSGWLPHLGRGGGRREHRTVVLPDWQGVGIGMRLSNRIAAMWKGLGQRAVSTTTHPGLIAARQRSADWRLTRAPSLARTHAGERVSHATCRLSAGFVYIGPSLPYEQALALRHS